MNKSEINYLESVIYTHIQLFFSKSAQIAISKVPLRWCTLASTSNPTEKAIYIPTDILTQQIPNDAWAVTFGRTKLTLWNALTPPCSEWQLQDPEMPLWYIHPSGAVMPAWNLATTLFNLLTLREEINDSSRDVHERYISKNSPRTINKKNLLEAPIFNDSVAALVAACVGIKNNGSPQAFLEDGLVSFPVLILSHDLDQLRGNDIWTQMIRLLRSFTKLKNLWWISKNFILPKRYYYDNINGMIAIERMLGFNSNLYFLNGRQGRYGARSGVAMIPQVKAKIPADWGIGMHYNYDTYLDNRRFKQQKIELEELLKQPVHSGRAHYLRFDPKQSWRFLVNKGIKVDESLGYSDRIGYRAGIAGPFQPYDPETQQALPIVEMPMMFMETALVEQYPNSAETVFEEHLHHITIVGGAVSLLFHPGQFHNPEYPETLGLYRKLLGTARQLGFISKKVTDFIHDKVISNPI